MIFDLAILTLILEDRLHPKYIVNEHGVVINGDVYLDLKLSKDSYCQSVKIKGYEYKGRFAAEVSAMYSTRGHTSPLSVNYQTNWFSSPEEAVIHFLEREIKDHERNKDVGQKDKKFVKLIREELNKRTTHE